jgi:DNA-binding transcriptional MerR regulator
MSRTIDGNTTPLWKVGEIAERTGLSVRTLHHYDEIGLLRPSGRTPSAHGSGHRRYSLADLARLQQILSLKQLGFDLEAVRAYLDRADFDPREVVRLHLEKVRGQAAELARLEARLSALAAVLDKAETVSADDFLTTIKEITMIEKYYTPEQLESLKARAATVGEERMRQAPNDWAELGAAVKAEMDAGTDPADPKVQELARRWFALVNEFTGGDPGIFRSLKNMYQNEDTIHGMDVAGYWRPMQQYIQKAADAAGLKLP